MLPDDCGAGHVTLSRGNMLLLQNMTKAAAFHTTRTCSCAASILPSGTAVPLLQHRTCRVQRPPHDTPSLLTSSPSLLLFVFVSSTTRVAGRVGTVQPRCLFHVTMSKRSSGNALGASPAKAARQSDSTPDRQAAEANARTAGTGVEASPTDPTDAGMSGGGGDWQKKLEKAGKKLEKAEQTCAEEEKTYEVTQEDLKRHWMKNPGDTTSDQYKKLEEWELTAKAAYKVAQTQVVVAEAEKTRAEMEKKYEVAQEDLKGHWAAHPGDTTSDQYKKLEEWELTAKAAYKVAQTQVVVAEAEKTRAEMEKKYEVAQAKLAVHKAANPGDTTSAGYVRLVTAQERADVAYEVAQTQVVVAEAEKTRAKEEGKYEVAQAKLAVHKAANPGDTTSAGYVRLEAAQERAYFAYEAARTEVKRARANLTEIKRQTEVVTVVVCRLTHVPFCHTALVRYSKSALLPLPPGR